MTCPRGEHSLKKNPSCNHWKTIQTSIAKVLLAKKIYFSTNGKLVEISHADVVCIKLKTGLLYAAVIKKKKFLQKDQMKLRKK